MLRIVILLVIFIMMAEQKICAAQDPGPMGAAFYFTTDDPIIPMIQPANTWQNPAENFNTEDVISWNSLYTGGGFTHDEDAHLIYTGSTPKTFVIRARVAGSCNSLAEDNTTFLQFGISIAENDPTPEQVIQAEQIASGSREARPISLSGEIIVQLNPGDVIEPCLFVSEETSKTTTFLYVAISEWNTLY